MSDKNKLYPTYEEFKKIYESEEYKAAQAEKEAEEAEGTENEVNEQDQAGSGITHITIADSFANIPDKGAGIVTDDQNIVFVTSGTTESPGAGTTYAFYSGKGVAAKKGNIAVVLSQSLTGLDQDNGVWKATQEAPNPGMYAFQYYIEQGADISAPSGKPVQFNKEFGFQAVAKEDDINNFGARVIRGFLNISRKDPNPLNTLAGGGGVEPFLGIIKAMADQVNKSGVAAIGGELNKEAVRKAIRNKV